MNTFILVLIINIAIIALITFLSDFDIKEKLVLGGIIEGLILLIYIGVYLTLGK